MSYPQFGYPYSSAPQFLMTTNSLSTCCESGGRTLADSGPAASAQAPVYCPVYESRLLATARHELNSAAALGVYGGPYGGSQGYGNYMTYGSEASAFYSLNSFDSKDAPGSAHAGLAPAAAAYYPYEPALGQYPYDRYGTMDSGTRRKNATRETTSTLKAWLQEHRKNPYPTKGEKIMLAIITKMTLTQVSTWFANARRRLKKENKVTWGARSKDQEDGALFGSDTEGDPEKAEDDEEIDLESIDIDEHDGDQSNEDEEDKAEAPRAPDAPTALARDQGSPLMASDALKPPDSPLGLAKELPEPGSTRLLSPGAAAAGGLQGAPNSKPKIWSLAETATSPDGAPKASPPPPSGHPGGAHGPPAGSPLQHPAFLPSHGLYTCHIGKFSNWTNGAFLAQGSLLNVRSFLGVGAPHGPHLSAPPPPQPPVPVAAGVLHGDKASARSSPSLPERDLLPRPDSPAQQLKSPFQPVRDNSLATQEGTPRILAALPSA